MAGGGRKGERRVEQGGHVESTGGRLLAFVRDPPQVEVGRRPLGGGGGGVQGGGASREGRLGGGGGPGGALWGGGVVTRLG